MTPWEIAEKVAEELQGQCLKDIDRLLDDLGDPEIKDLTAFHHELDNLVFCCSDCGWWCEASEEADPDETGRPHDTICEDCNEG